jgi:osmoprotectant transport system permease protein
MNDVASVVEVAHGNVVLGQLTRPLFEPGWIADNTGRIWDATVQHIYLTSTSVGVGFVLSIALAIVGLRYRRLLGPILGFGGLLYTIPSLAMFSFLLPITGISDAMAITTLVTYTLLILVRNITSAIDGVPADVREAADGMGYRSARRLWEIELPIALPVIIAGVRIATVTVIGLVTVTALIGRGGLGSFILNGIRLTALHPTMVLVGTVLSVVLAIVVDLTLLGVERALTPWARRRATV